MSDTANRREFLKTATSVGASLPFAGAAFARGAKTSGSRVLGANDRINIGVVGVGGRGYYVAEAFTDYAEKNNNACQIAMVCDVYERRKKRAAERFKADSTLDWHEVVARKDLDAVIVATPDHWHAKIALAAMDNGKDVYCEKPMCHTNDEARQLINTVKETKRVFQVGSQTTSADQWYKAKKAIADGMIGQMLMSQGSYHRNSIEGEWNWTIDPGAGPDAKGDDYIDWKTWLGPAQNRPWDADRFFRFRKYWDYSGGIATDLFYHRLSPIMFAIGNPEFPTRVMAGGGIYSPVDGDVRDVPDTYFTSIEFPSKFAILIGSSMLNATGFAQGQPQLIRGTKGTLYLENTKLRIVPERPYREEFKKKYNTEELIVEVDNKGEYQGKPWTSDHQSNFINAIRGKEAVHFDVDLGYKAMVAIRLGVDAYRSGQVMYFDRSREKATNRVTLA